eukprot:Skav217607  [mRNA]  locus=scaffold2172:203589:220867:+ [translate_table: standard]
MGCWAFPVGLWWSVLRLAATQLQLQRRWLVLDEEEWRRRNSVLQETRVFASTCACLLIVASLSTFASGLGPGLSSNPPLAPLNFAAVLSPVVPLLVMKAEKQWLWHLWPPREHLLEVQAHLPWMAVIFAITMSNLLMAGFLCLDQQVVLLMFDLLPSSQVQRAKLEHDMRQPDPINGLLLATYVLSSICAAVHLPTVLRSLRVDPAEVALQLAHLQRLHAMGWREAQSIAAHRWGRREEPTGEGSAKIDQLWLSPELVGLMEDVWTRRDRWSDHASVEVKLKLDDTVRFACTWHKPHSFPWPPEWSTAASWDPNVHPTRHMQRCGTTLNVMRSVMPNSRESMFRSINSAVVRPCSPARFGCSQRLSIPCHHPAVVLHLSVLRTPDVFGRSVFMPLDSTEVSCDGGVCVSYNLNCMTGMVTCHRPPCMITEVFDQFKKELRSLEQALTAHRVRQAAAKRKDVMSVVFGDIKVPRPQLVDTLIRRTEAEIEDVLPDESAIVLAQPTQFLPDLPLVANGRPLQVIELTPDKVWVDSLDDLEIGQLIIQEDVASSDEAILAQLRAAWEPRWNKLKHVQPSKRALAARYQGIENGSPWPKQCITGFVQSLAKTHQATLADHYRPITVYALPYRLCSSARSREVLHALEPHLPASIREGQSRNIWLTLASQLERAHFHSTPLAGIMLDIRKCFNALPRYPIWSALLTMQFPHEMLRAWGSFVNMQSRRFQVRGSVSDDITSTVGLPEGCGFSVFGMVVVNLMLERWLVAMGPKAQLWAFVDDIQIVLRDPGLLEKCWKAVSDFIDMLDLSIDEGKTFAWSAQASQTASHLDGTLYHQRGRAHFEAKNSGACPWCGKPDGFYHPAWECEHFDEDRANLPSEVRELLPQLPRCLTCHGWPILPPEVTALRKLLCSLPDASLLPAPKLDPDTARNLFIDGSCLHGGDPVLRLASWAITWASADVFELRSELLACGVVPGLLQTSYRSEVYALWKLRLFTTTAWWIRQRLALMVDGHFRFCTRGKLLHMLCGINEESPNMFMMFALRLLGELLHPNLARPMHPEFLADAPEPVPDVAWETSQALSKKLGSGNVACVAAWWRTLGVPAATHGGKLVWVSWLYLFMSFVRHSGSGEPRCVGRKWMDGKQVLRDAKQLSLMKRTRAFQSFLRQWWKHHHFETPGKYIRGAGIAIDVRLNFVKLVWPLEDIERSDGIVIGAVGVVKKFSQLDGVPVDPVCEEMARFITSNAPAFTPADSERAADDKEWRGTRTQWVNWMNDFEAERTEVAEKDTWTANSVIHEAIDRYFKPDAPPKFWHNGKDGERRGTRKRAAAHAVLLRGTGVFRVNGEQDMCNEHIVGATPVVPVVPPHMWLWVISMPVE